MSLGIEGPGGGRPSLWQGVEHVPGDGARDVFLQLDNAGAEIVARTLHPLLGKTADANFLETVRFVSQVSHVAETNGPGVQRLVTRLTNVEPTVRDRFGQLAMTLHQRAIMRALANTPEEPAARLGELGVEPTVK